MPSSRSRRSFLPPAQQPNIATTSHIQTGLSPGQATPSSPSLANSPASGSPLLASPVLDPPSRSSSYAPSSTVPDHSISPSTGVENSLTPSPVLETSLPPYVVFHPPMPPFTTPHIPLVPSTFHHPSPSYSTYPPASTPSRMATPSPPIPPTPLLHPATASTPVFLSPVTSGLVQFRHPGYPDDQNIMFSLPTLDRSDLTEDGEYTWGLHRATALRACSIIACNSDGFLVTAILAPSNCSVCAPPQSPPPPTTLLLATEYYYYPDGWSPQDYPYPVCPKFLHWSFPHGNVPDEWGSVVFTQADRRSRCVPVPSQYTSAVAARDITCRLSGFVECLRTAHLIPESEKEWFQRNSMDIYNLNRGLHGRYVTSDIQNCILVRQDLLTIFDSKAFVLVPKMGTMFVHFVKDGPNYAPTYHNSTTVKMDVAVEFLYARFAWAILPLVSNFASKPQVRIKVFNPDISGWEIMTSGEYHYKEANQNTNKRGRAASGIDNAAPSEGHMNHPSQRMRASEYPRWPSYVTIPTSRLRIPLINTMPRKPGPATPAPPPPPAENIVLDYQ